MGRWIAILALVGVCCTPTPSFAETPARSLLLGAENTRPARRTMMPHMRQVLLHGVQVRSQSREARALRVQIRPNQAGLRIGIMF